MNTKERILELLERHRGESVSGERIAGMLEISRNAVWKAIRELQKDGYDIAAATNKGYCLSEKSDVLSALGIAPYLSPSGPVSAENIHIYKSLESTNRTAKEMAVAGAAHGTVVLADHQTSGRGRYARSFFSLPGGGLYMSIVLRPEFLPFANLTIVTAHAAVAVCEAIEATSDKSPAIKWVNDILIDGKKVCGILTEAITDVESGTPGWMVLGIGINVSIRPEDFPPDLRDSATSVFPEAGMRNRLAAEVINRIAGNAPPSEEEIFEKYRKRLVMLGKEITVVQGETSYKATAMDIDPAGHLIVKTEAGEVLTLSSGEIRILQ